MTLRFPHPLVLLVAGILLAAGLTWIVPAGRYDRRADGKGHEVVVPGTYHRVEAKPATPFEAMVKISKGMTVAADIIFFVFLVGGAFAVVDRTGALRQAVDWLLHRLRDRRAWIIPVVCAVFAVGGALENLQEEIIAMVPVLLLLCRRLGYDALTAVGMSIGAASVGSSFSPVNPFQAVIAQQVAELPPFSGWAFRLAFLVPALALWTWGVHRHAARQVRADGPDADTGSGQETAAGDDALPAEAAGWRTALILSLVAVAFALFILGVTRWDWDFGKTSAVFFVLGIAAGLIGRLGFNGTSEAFVEGFRSMAFAALLIGFARAIFVVLDDGQVVDTLVAGMFAPLGHLPVALSAVGMMAMQTVLHFPVPSVSGQAALTMPLLSPLADLLGLSRQVVVLAYQYGAGLCELLTPTNAALVAILGAARVRFDEWLRFVWPLYLGLVALGVLAVLVGVATGLR